MSTSAEFTGVKRGHLPGDLAMWFFILAELSVFAILILAFAVTQALKPQMFSDSRLLLDTSTGLAMTLSLLTGGLFAALAQEQVRRSRPRRGAVYLLAALLAASVYVLLKLTEYHHLLDSGLGMEHNTFFILGWLAERCRRGLYSADNRSGFESGVLYWHMVDLIWVVLFPLVYVLS
ncbi:Quinol oxidase subunit 3 [compost metagenome]